MRELRTQDVRTRVKGRPALERRLYGLIRAVHRFGRFRAAGPSDVRWAGHMIDGLTATVEAVQRVGKIGNDR
jgi:hypothetical protein